MCRAIQNKRWEHWHLVLRSSMTMRICIQLLALENCWNISTGCYLTTLPISLILLRVTTTYLPTWRTGWDHSASTKWAVDGRCQNVAWAQRWQTSLTQAYKNLFPDMISASIPVETTLRSSLSMYIFFVYNNFCLVCLFC
jgi:hypothetical protein